MTYRHTQKAAGWVLPLGEGLILLSVLGAAASGEAVAVVIALIVALVLGTVVVLFTRLTVEVDTTVLSASFGWGWPRKKLQLRDATSARIVRNRWWYGFGIRLIPHGSMWNVWGLDAVELGLTGAKVLRIGTDEPESLLAAITRTVPAAPQSGP